MLTCLLVWLQLSQGIDAPISKVRYSDGWFEKLGVGLRMPTLIVQHTTESKPRWPILEQPGQLPSAQWLREPKVMINADC